MDGSGRLVLDADLKTINFSVMYTHRIINNFKSEMNNSESNN